ncbi:MAG: hypothetical protein IJ779_00990 [Ruminococcus sp.]|nr:hypothetical protein [Ruminococcus sp.]
MKKKILLLLASVMLSGCGNIDVSSTEEVTTANTETAVTEVTATVSTDIAEEVTAMAQENYKTYFPVDNRCTQNGFAVFFIYPVTEFTDEYRDLIENELHKVWEKYFPMCAGSEFSNNVYVYTADYEYIYDEQKDKVIPDILDALDNIEGIGRVIITNGNDPDSDEADDEYDDSNFLDEMLKIPQDELYYTAHAEGMEGECFYYSVYFTDGVADENRVKTVSDAVNSYDFGLIDDDYAGYISVSADEGKVSVYLDLGNVQPQNEMRSIHGILYALNQVGDIEKVIINEGMY